MNETLLKQIGVWLIAGAFATLVGLASAILPWWLVVPVFLLPMLVAAGWRWPLMAFVFVLLAALGVLPVVKNKLVDLLLVAFLGLMIVVRLHDLPRIMARYRPQLFMMAVLMLCALLSAAYGHLYQRHFTAYVYGETSIILHWLMFLGVALLAHDEKDAEKVLQVIIGLAMVLCLVALAQSFFALRLNFSGESRVEVLDEASGGISAIKRSLVPGVPLVLFSYFLSLQALLRGSGRRWAWGIVWLITSLALFVSFGRALWAVTALLSVAAAAMIGRRALLRFILLSGVIGASLAALLAVLQPDVLTGIVNRMTSVRNEGGASTSLGWRLTENYFAIPQIMNSPWIGLGLGAEYKPRFVELRYFSEQTHYIHNGYLYVLLKMGVVGLLLYLAFYWTLLRACIAERFFLREEYAPRAATLLVLVAVLLLNFTQPEFFASVTITAMATLIPVAHQARLWRRPRATV
ncbi:MAG: O-antigen ligase family protein [Aquabacterium sp.]|nr:O-antigen ligase family protein [Aquabacterium sp.]